MHTVEFIPSAWLEQSYWALTVGQKLVCHSRPIEVERRSLVRREADQIEKLVRELWGQP
jgi:hypothetical protein